MSSSNVTHVTDDSFPAQVEQSRSPRRDGYLSCHFYVPALMPAGDYTLWIEVKDLTGRSSSQNLPNHRTALQSLPFRVRNPGLARVQP